MYTTALLFRVAKVISIFSIGIMGLLIVIGNTTDFDTNYRFVEHVMKMDTIYPQSHIQYRSINNSLIFHLGYFFIIGLQVTMTFCCLKGSWQMARNLKNNAAAFYDSKNWAIAGLILGIIIWFVGFELIGGEWFGMWQSQSWNGLGSAERILTFLVLTLILLQGKDDGIAGHPLP
jgi:predicted small integral membrane protein